MLVWLYEVWFLFVMQFNLAYEALEGFSPFQNMHIEDVHICQSSKNVSTSLILSRRVKFM
jgi:hypothetical protein